MRRFFEREGDDRDVSLLVLVDTASIMESGKLFIDSLCGFLENSPCSSIMSVFRLPEADQLTPVGVQSTLVSMMHLIENSYGNFVVTDSAQDWQTPVDATPNQMNVWDVDNEVRFDKYA